MVTENGGSRSPPVSGDLDLASRRRVAQPPRLDFLRADAPGLTPHLGLPAQRSPRLFPAGAPPRSPRGGPPYFHPHDPSRPPPSPRNDFGGGGGGEPFRATPQYRAPTFPPHFADQDPRRPPNEQHGGFDRQNHRKVPPLKPGLRISNSTSRLYTRRPKGPHYNDRRQNDTGGQGLPPPRFPYHGGVAEGEDVLRSSLNSAMTSRSSIEHTSGTERSSVLTKSSSITDLSPDTPDGPSDRDGGMSVEDAISMYLDGFSDVTEEPASPECDKFLKTQTIAPVHSAEVPVNNGEDDDDDDGYTSDEHSPQIEAVEDLPPVPPLPQDLPEPVSMSPINQDEPPQETTIIVPGMVPPGFLPGTDNHDRYGFRKTTLYITLDQYEGWNRQYNQFTASSKTKWIKLLQEHGLNTSDPTVFPPKSNKVKRFIRKGIPYEYRGAAWFFYAGGYELLNRNMGLYDELVKRAMESPSNDDKEHIERDLHRTFPDNVHFKPEMAKDAPNSGSSNPKHGSITVETQMIRSLRRVLYAFALHSPKIGYTQSLNFITGLLLLFLPEEKAFWMLHLITSAYLPGTHEISLEGANVDLWTLMVLLKETLPHLFAKIATTGPTNARGKLPPFTVDTRLPDITLGLTNWLMSLFIGSLPLETTLRVWDVFFYEGSKTFFRVSLAIFKACEKDILAVSDPMEVFQVVQTVPKKLLDANTLLDDTFVRRNRVGQAKIEQLRSARRTAVRQEKMRRSLTAQKGLAVANEEWPSRTRTPVPGAERSVAGGWRHMRQHAFR